MKLLPSCALLLLATTACKTTPDYGRALPPGAPALIPLAPGEAHPDFGRQWDERWELLPSVCLLYTSPSPRDS